MLKRTNIHIKQGLIFQFKAFDANTLSSDKLILGCKYSQACVGVLEHHMLSQQNF